MERTGEKNYLEAVGRRKTSVARVRITEASKPSFVVNEKDVIEYFPTKELQKDAQDPILATKLPQKFKVTVKVEGGGIASQAGAVRHGLARALVVYDEGLRKALKDLEFLKRDSRTKERRKFGLKKARKAPQWSKR